MRFYVDSNILKDGVLSVVKALPLRSSMPVLDGVQLLADEQGVLLRCSDLTLQKECRLPATVEEEGECVIKGRIFSDIVRKLPDGNAFFSVDGQTLTIRCSRSVNQLQCMEYDEFPQMTFDGDDTFTIAFDREKGKKTIEHTAFAVALDDARPALVGVLMETEGKTLSMVATDSYQFAKNAMPIENEAPEKRVVVPGKTVSENFKTKKRKKARPDELLVFPNTHEAIVDQDTWDLANKLRKRSPQKASVQRQGYASPVRIDLLCRLRGKDGLRFTGICS